MPDNIGLTTPKAGNNIETTLETPKGSNSGFEVTEEDKILKRGQEEGMASISGVPSDSNMHANNFDKKKDDVLVLPSGENLTEDDLTKNNLTDKKLGEVGKLAHMNENYIQDQFGVLYRPVYVGEAFTPKHDTLIYNNKYYITEGLGNCIFCQGAGKVTVEKLGLKDCPDCDGTGDVQSAQPDLMQQSQLPQNNIVPNKPIPQQPNISQPEIPQQDEQLQPEQWNNDIQNPIDKNTEQEEPKYLSSGKKPEKDLFGEAKGDDWITVKGSHVKIKKGQTKQQAVDDFISKQNTEPPKEDLEDWKPTKQDDNDDYDVDTGNPEEQDLDLSDNKFPSTTNYPDINKAKQINKGRFKINNNPSKKGDWDNVEKNEITDDTKKFSHKFARSKHNTKGLTAKQIQIKNTQYDKLKNIDNNIFEELDFAKHSDVWTSDGMSKYKDALAQKLGGRYDIDSDLHEWLTDDNYHSLTQAIKELKAGIKDGEMENWWDNSTLKSKQKLFDWDNPKLDVKYDELDTSGQISMRARYIDRHTGQESKKKSDESFNKVVEACGCKNKAIESIQKYETFIGNQIKILQKKAKAGEGVGILYGLPNISKQGRKIKGTLAYAGVSLNDRIYLPETLAKGHGRTLPLLLNHSSTAGAEEELHRLTPEMIEYLENDRDYQVGEVTLTWDPEKLTLFYEGVVDHPFFQKEIDDMNMAVSLGIYYDSDSPTVCDESCYTLIKGAEFREVSLVYHAGFPIATIEAVEAKLKANALKAMNEGKLVTWADPDATMNKKKHEQNMNDSEEADRDIDAPLQSAIHHRKKTEPDFQYKKEDYESVAEEEEDPLSRGGSVDVELKDTGTTPTIDINDDLGTEPIVFESLTTKHDFSIRGVTGMTISNSNGVERYKLDPNMSYETNMVHFNVSPRGAEIFGEQLQPKMTTTPDITKILEAKPDIKFTDSDEDLFKKNKTLL